MPEARKLRCPAALVALTALAMVSQATAAQAGEAVAGKARFMAECSLCHSAEPGDGLGGMGPPLHNLMGKAAATIDPNFPYTPALRDSRLFWDSTTLDRFLTDPSKLVPGTVMPVATPDKTARAELIAYLLGVTDAALR